MTLLRVRADNNASMYILFIALRDIATTQVTFWNSVKGSNFLLCVQIKTCIVSKLFSNN